MLPLHISMHTLRHFLINKLQYTTSTLHNKQTVPWQWCQPSQWQLRHVTMAACHRRGEFFLDTTAQCWQLSKQQRATTSFLRLLIISLFQTLLKLSRKLVVAKLADRLQIQLKELCPTRTATVLHPSHTWWLKRLPSSCYHTDFMNNTAGPKKHHQFKWLYFNNWYMWYQGHHNFSVMHLHLLTSCDECYYWQSTFIAVLEIITICNSLLD